MMLHMNSPLVFRVFLSNWIYIILIFLAFTQFSEAADESFSPCPSSCKCGVVEESQSVSTVQVKSTSGAAPVMARCWIPANMIHLPCSPSWTIVHLQILTGHAPPNLSGPLIVNDSKAGFNDDIIYPNISVSPNLFQKCTSLTRLAIWERSQFSWLPQYWLRPLVNLERLFIQVPTLRSLPDHFFAFLPKLNFVKISKCTQLAHLTRDVFEPCPDGLHTLWLDGNGLRSKLPAGIFHQCQLHVLHLNENRLNKLDWGSLSGLNQLKSLYLQRNQLTGSLEQALGYRLDMTSTALASTPMLKNLDLSFNHLSSIEGIHWSGQCFKVANVANRGLCYLEELNLGHNRLRWIGLNSFDGIPRIRKLNMEGNSDLFAPEVSANLALVLYAVSVVNKHIQNLIIPVSLAHISSQRESVNGSMDVCHPNVDWLEKAPKYLSVVVRHLNRTSCSRFTLNELESIQTSTTLVTQSSLIATDDLNDFINQTSLLVVAANQSDNVDPIISFLRETNRLNLLALCFALVFVGFLIGLLPITFILCTTRTRQIRKRSKMESNIMPLFIKPPNQGTACILNSNHNNSQNGLLTSPLLKRNLNVGHNRALPPIPPGRMVHFNSPQVPILHGSADHIQTRPLGPNGKSAVPSLALGLPTSNSPIATVARRFNSAGNVYHQTRPLSGHSNISASRPRYDRLASARSSQISMNMTPLTMQNKMMVVPGTSTNYCPTDETALSGSIYSLTTVNSLRVTSPARSVLVPTGRTSAV